MGMLDGKVAIVTGAGNGVGRGEAVQLADHGAKLNVRDYGNTDNRGGKLALLGGIAPGKLLTLAKARAVAQLAKTMLESIAKIAAQFVHIFR